MAKNPKISARTPNFRVEKVTYLPTLRRCLISLTEYIMLEGGITERDSLRDYFRTKLCSWESKNPALRQLEEIETHRKDRKARL